MCLQQRMYVGAGKHQPQSKDTAFESNCWLTIANIKQNTIHAEEGCTSFVCLTLHVVSQLEPQGACAHIAPFHGFPDCEVFPLQKFPQYKTDIMNGFDQYLYQPALSTSMLLVSGYVVMLMLDILITQLCPQLCHPVARSASHISTHSHPDPVLVSPPPPTSI